METHSELLQVGTLVLVTVEESHAEKLSFLSPDNIHGLMAYIVFEIQYQRLQLHFCK